MVNPVRRRRLSSLNMGGKSISLKSAKLPARGHKEGTGRNFLGKNEQRGRRSYCETSPKQTPFKKGGRSS